MNNVIILQTQDHEWYGSDDRAEGRFKPKGGIEIEIASVPELSSKNDPLLLRLIELATFAVQRLDNPAKPHFLREVIGVNFVREDRLTESEKAQAEDGQIYEPRYVLAPVSGHPVPAPKARIVTLVGDNGYENVRVTGGAA